MYDFENIKEIINHYGSHYQKLKAVEELSELQTAIIQDANKVKDNRYNVVEEIADVVLMIEQLLIIYDIADEVIDFLVSYKIDRTLERIENENINIKRNIKRVNSNNAGCR